MYEEVGSESGPRDWFFLLAFLSICLNPSWQKLGGSLY